MTHFTLQHRFTGGLWQPRRSKKVEEFVTAQTQFLARAYSDELRDSVAILARHHDGKPIRFYKRIFEVVVPVGGTLTMSFQADGDTDKKREE